MPIDLIGGALLLLVFLVGTTTRANLGALGLVASLIMGSLVLGEDATELLKGFPATMFVLFLGVTYLFSVATANGTMDWLVAWAARLVRGRAYAVPAGLFVASLLVGSVGVPGPAAVAMLAPVGLRLGRQYGVPVFVGALMVTMGACAGAFSPFGLISIVSVQGTRNAGLEISPLSYYLLSVAVWAAVAAVVLVVAAVRGRVRTATPALVTAGGPAGGADDEPGTGGTGADDEIPELPDPGPLTLPVGITLLGIASVLAASIAFDLDLGLLALTVALVLHLLFPREKSLAGISWDVILMICGLMTYIAVLQRAGTIDRIGEALAGFSVPLLAALVLCFTAGLISAFASSPATVGAMLPLAIPLMTTAGLPVLGMTTALGLSSVLVDASPFSASGALAVAGAPVDQRPKLVKALTLWAVAMLILAPIISVGLLLALPAIL